MGFSLTTSRILVTSTEIICIEANSLYFDIQAKSFLVCFAFFQLLPKNWFRSCCEKFWRFCSKVQCNCCCRFKFCFILLQHLLPFSLSLCLSFSLTLSLSDCHSDCLSLTVSRSLTLSRSRCLSITVSLSLSLYL